MGHSHLRMKHDRFALSDDLDHRPLAQVEDGGHGDLEHVLPIPSVDRHLDDQSQGEATLHLLDEHSNREVAGL